MFEKTLTDVVKGIRASKRDTALYISQCIAEIRTEINSSDMHVKANALQKLTFLQMMGYSMSWASFASIEVMSSPRFAHKRIGYLAASQGFTQDTDVILLTTNLLKKELRGAVGGGMQGVYEAGLAVNCISNIVTEELARDLLPELTNLTGHPQPYLRKKAILCLFKLFVKYPQGLRLTFGKIQQCLQDSDSSVVSCAVNVITELSDKNPKNYLHLAPAFFDLLTKSSNNWMLIKVVKLLGSLVPEEPRLARKLLDPLANIVKNTQAKSLLYEAVHAITLCLPYCRKNDGSMPAIVPEIVVLCAQTLRDLVEQTDQNLKYLGLVGFGSLMQSHPRVLSAPDYRPLILACLSDEDVTIRSRSLDLLTGMVTRKNLVELVAQLLDHVVLATGSYKHDLVAKIVEMCSGEKYALLQDFAWYLDVLFRIGHMRGIEGHGDLLQAQVTDVALRVLPVRPYAVRRSIEILLEREGNVSDDPYGDNGRGKHIMSDILPAIAWIIGEYSDLIRQAIKTQDDDEEEEEFFFDSESMGTYHAIIQALTDPSKFQKQPANTQKVFVQAITKVLAAASADRQVRNEELEACVTSILEGLSIYMQSTDVEVAERSFAVFELLKSLDLTVTYLDKVADLSETDDESEDGDLLGMNGGGDSTKKKSHKPAGRKSLASRLRDASTTLSYIVKPAPMKPIGTKAQKKKRDSTLGATIDLDQAVDLSIFQDFVDEETAFRERKLPVEAVCFTQQLPLKPEERPPLVSQVAQGMLPPSHISMDSGTSFQNPSTTLPAVSAPRQRESDPFYLDSGPQSSSGEEDRGTHRFGTIQLGDSEEDREKAKKAKKKKDKRAKREKQEGFSMLFDVDGTLPTHNASDSVEVYHSDDEEFDESAVAPGGRQGKKKGPSKEFAGLAQVDLTTPLREDEIMPERQHRVVPERRKEPTPSTKPRKRTKKKKKDKAGKDQAAVVGDLLDLGGFGSADGGGEPSCIAAVAPSNPINSAFDDLLEITFPATQTTALQPDTEVSASGFQPIQPNKQSSLDEAAQSSGKSSKRPWIKGSIKSANAALSPVDWSAVSLSYRVYRSKQGDGPGLMLSFCIRNQSATSINDLSLSFRDSHTVQLGSISSGASCESGKVGPFKISSIDDSQELKGSFQTPEGSVGVKVVLPAAFHLIPDENLSLDTIAEELTSQEWSSNSVKVEIPTGVKVEHVVEVLRTYLHAAEVNDSAVSPSTATLACRSNSGARVRFLVKVKETSVKVDVKSTNAKFGKAIASDIKRLVII